MAASSMLGAAAAGGVLRPVAAMLGTGSLCHYDPDIYRAGSNPRNGFSVRCLRDAD